MVEDSGSVHLRALQLRDSLQRVRTTEGVPLAWHLHGINLQYVGSKAVSFA